jgi:hypothetical protein
MNVYKKIIEAVVDSKVTVVEVATEVETVKE